MSLRSIFVSALLLFALGCQCPHEALPLDPGVAFLGDSIMCVNAEKCLNVSAQFGMRAGFRVTDYSTDGAFFSGGSVQEIPTAYEEALAAQPELDLVVLDGGLNDLTHECLDEELPDCTAVTDAIETEVEELLQRMLDDGLSQVVYVGLYELKGDKANYDKARADLMNALSSWCGEHDVLFLETEPLFRLHPEYYRDANHPSILGSEAIAGLLTEAILPGS